MANHPKPCAVCGELICDLKRYSAASWAKRRYCSVNCERTTKRTVHREATEKLLYLKEEAEWLLSFRTWPPDVAQRLGYSPKTLRTWFSQCGWIELAEQFQDADSKKVA